MDDAHAEQFERLVKAFAPGATLVRHWPLTGGVSAQTTALEIRRDNGQTERFVVRVHGPRDVARDPEIAAHEFRLLQMLRNSGIPVPKPVHVHRAGEIFDGQAVVVEFIDGEIITEPKSPARHVAEFAAWLARIHSVDLDANDLSFLAGDHADISNRLDPEDSDSVIVLEILESLRRHWPVESRNAPVLLHGDYWQGNLLWKNDRLAAIIDWEDAAVGDPLSDLARTRLELHWALGEMARERFTAHYLSYRDIDVDSLAAWDLAMALGFARDFTSWGLPEDRERQMYADIERFVQQAKQQLAVDRG